jgi:hypothetical protein
MSVGAFARADYERSPSVFVVDYVYQVDVKVDELLE